jgi:hypothetical protein
LLIGLGIDFGLHIITNYNEAHAQGYPSKDALIYTLERTGVAVILGGLTTAIAFFALAFVRLQNVYAIWDCRWLRYFNMPVRHAGAAARPGSLVW